VAVVGDVRNEDDVQRTVDTAVEHFGGVDICVNNASAIATEPTEKLAAKKFDLMMDINVRGTFLLTKAALPYLKKSPAAHVLTLAPPMNMSPHWLVAHPTYTLSKYGMTLLSLGWAAEYSELNIGFSCLWPETYIATSAVANLAEGDKLAARSRDPQIMGDAAAEIFSRRPADVNGKCYIDSQVLTEAGQTDLSRYGGGDDPILDIFVDRS
jgi:NAD(P)-dependent dehydrogenase (short-subunit alcohol dehydrogenase family)